jgi:hypothetical protein
MTNALISLALERLEPGAEFIVIGDTLEGIDWLDPVKYRPTDPDIEAMVATIEDEIAATLYLTNRSREYRTRGATTEALTAALWEKTVNGDSTAANALKVITDQVDAEYPIPAAE